MTETLSSIKRGRTTFTRRQTATIAAVAEVMVGACPTDPVTAATMARRVVNTLADADPSRVRQIRWLLWFVDWLLPVLVLRPWPFSRMTRSQRTAALTTLVNAPWPPVTRVVARSLKLLSCVGYYGDPRTQTRLGYQPFESRPRAIGQDQSPLRYDDPFIRP